MSVLYLAVRRDCNSSDCEYTPGTALNDDSSAVVAPASSQGHQAAGRTSRNNDREKSSRCSTKAERVLEGDEKSCHLINVRPPSRASDL